MGLENIIYTRPADKYIVQQREPVRDRCPECGSDNIKRYPVINYRGPKVAVKCQDCLYCLRYEDPTPEDRWPPYWPVTRGWKPTTAG